MKERKTFRGIYLKGDAGAFSATIATLNVVDHVGDVTFPGAFPVGKVIPISAFGHASWADALPVGKAVLRADATRAWVEGRFFIDTVDGLDTYRVAKELGPLLEWSYGFDILEKASPGDARLAPWPKAQRGLVRVEVFEASPVLRGAGIGTRTDHVKLAATTQGTRPRDPELDEIRALTVRRSDPELELIRYKTVERNPGRRPIDGLSEVRRATVTRTAKALYRRTRRLVDAVLDR